MSASTYQVTFALYPRLCEIVECDNEAHWISKSTRHDSRGHIEEISTMRVCYEHKAAQEARYNHGK